MSTCDRMFFKLYIASCFVIFCYDNYIFIGIIHLVRAAIDDCKIKLQIFDSYGTTKTVVERDDRIVITCQKPGAYKIILEENQDSETRLKHKIASNSNSGLMNISVDDMMSIQTGIRCYCVYGQSNKQSAGPVNLYSRLCDKYDCQKCGASTTACFVDRYNQCSTAYQSACASISTHVGTDFGGFEIGFSPLYSPVAGVCSAVRNYKNKKVVPYKSMCEAMANRDKESPLFEISDIDKCEQGIILNICIHYIYTIRFIS